MRSSQSRRLLNIAGVLAGFLIGQGALFVLSSVLLFEGRPELVGELGLALGTLSLGVWVLDMGGAYYLPRAHAHNQLSSAIPVVIAGRLLFGIPIAIGAAVALHLFRAEASFATQVILLGVAFSSPVWSLNVSGALDASGHAGLAGIVGNLGTLFAVVYAFIARTQIDPFWLAGAFSTGLLITVAIQYLVLKAKVPMELTFKFPATDEVVRFTRFGVGYVFSQLPAQAYARLIILLVTAVSGAAAAGYYVYVKTLMNAFAQAAVAIRRVDYPHLINRLKSTEHEFLNLVAGGRSVYLLAVMPLIGSLLLLPFGVAYEKFARVATLLPYFSAVFAVWVFASNAGNVVIATGRMREFVAWNLASILFGLVLVLVLLPLLDVRGVAVAELCMHLMQLALFYRIYTHSMVERRCESVS